MKLFLLTILLFTITLHSQAVFEPVESDVYGFLERQSVKGLISFNSEIKPLLRSELTSKLLKLNDMRSELSNTDKDLLDFYMDEYHHEIKMQQTDGIFNADLRFLSSGPTGNRFRFFEYSGKNFSLFADPMLSFSYKTEYDENVFVRRNGLRAHGYVLNNWGFEFRFFDNEETGDRLDYGKYLIPDRGVVITKRKPDAFEYDEVNASVTYEWSTGLLSLGKDNFSIGSARHGNIILSDKAPSFPFIRFDFYPVDWLRFFYFHGFLVSNLPDSSTLRYGSVPRRTAIADVPKFIAFHTLSIYPIRDLSVTVGESIVYSEYVQPIYFIPVMFFRVADHYLGRTNQSSSGNAQMFIDASFKVSPLAAKIYGSLFIDELSLNKLFEGENHSAIGYTAGAEFFDPLFANSSFCLEYTKISPFVYMNSVDAQLYSNEFYKLGHWIESNGDIFSASYGQNFTRALKLQLHGWYFRKGRTELPEEQYQSPYPATLYGERRNDLSLKISLGYRPYHALTAEVYYFYRSIQDEDELRTPSGYRGTFNDFGIKLSYGF